MNRYYKASLMATVACLVASPALAQVEASPTDPVLAQTEASPADPAVSDAGIVVTGSRINRADLNTASPVTLIGQDEIGLQQPDTAEALLRDLPSVRPSFGPGVNNGGDGSSSVDLRGLGTNRTLVLLDGRRIVPFGLDGITDLKHHSSSSLRACRCGDRGSFFSIWR